MRWLITLLVLGACASTDPSSYTVECRAYAENSHREYEASMRGLIARTNRSDLRQRLIDHENNLESSMQSITDTCSRDRVRVARSQNHDRFIPVLALVAGAAGDAAMLQADRNFVRQEVRYWQRNPIR